MQLSHQQLGKRYTLLRLLDSGNMADVYLARDEHEKHQVAIKVIKPDMQYSSLLLRFSREGKIAASLHHAHIIHTYSCEEEILANPDATDESELKVLYIVMEYVEGGNLKQWLKHQPLRPLAEILRIFEQLCAAVQYLHYKGVIHRDIKPANILFRESPRRGKQIEVVLTDFGLALLAEDTHVSLPQAGTPAYMAPEQWLGKPKFASDIFSLGVVLYRLCTGRLPSSERPLEKASQLNPSLPPALDDVILCALSNDPSERFASASLFWQAISSAAMPTNQSSIIPLPKLGVTIPNLLPQPLPTRIGETTEPLYGGAVLVGPSVPVRHISQPNRNYPIVSIIGRMVATLLLVGTLLPIIGVLAATSTVSATLTANITITPANKMVQDTFLIQGVTSNANPNNRQVAMRSLSSTQTDTKQVNLTSVHQDGKSAIGSITLYNGSVDPFTVVSGTSFQVGSVQIITDKNVVVPAATLGSTALQPGETIVPAHAVQGIAAGNIAAYAIKQFPCCGNRAIAAENQNAFTGGVDPVNYNVLKQEDVDKVTTADQVLLKTQAQKAIQAQMTLGEKLLSGIQCDPAKTTEDVQPNVPVTNTTAHVTVSVGCSAQVVSGSSVQAIAQKALQEKASQAPGVGYVQAGSIVVTPIRSPQVQPNGSITFSVTARGVWYYPWTDVMKQNLLSKVKGQKYAQADVVVKSYAGVSNGKITLSIGNMLPNDVRWITLNVTTVAGLSAGS